MLLDFTSTILSAKPIFQKGEPIATHTNFMQIYFKICQLLNWPIVDPPDVTKISLQSTLYEIWEINQPLSKSPDMADRS